MRRFYTRRGNHLRFCSPTASSRSIRIDARADAGFEQQKAQPVTARSIRIVALPAWAGKSLTAKARRARRFGKLCVLGVFAVPAKRPVRSGRARIVRPAQGL